MENIGFLFQQMDLYLQTLGLGVCWLGMGKLNPKTTQQVEGMKFVIMLAFGHPAQEVLERLAAYGCIIRRTDLEGTIILRG